MPYTMKSLKNRELELRQIVQTSKQYNSIRSAMDKLREVHFQMTQLKIRG